jgi:hypothetical protein
MLDRLTLEDKTIIDNVSACTPRDAAGDSPRVSYESAATRRRRNVGQRTKTPLGQERRFQ